MKQLIRYLPILISTVVGCALLIYALLPSPVSVELVSVIQGPMLVTVDEDGKTRVRERYIVVAPISGLLARLQLHPGDVVEANKTVVATIEPTNPALLDARSLAEAESRVKAAEASVELAKAKLEAAREAHGLALHDLARAKDLAQKQAMSQADLDAAEHQERIAAANLRAAEFGDRVATFELETNKSAFVRTRPDSAEGSESEGRKEFGRINVMSPIDGQVFRVIQESATVAVSGQPLVEIGNLHELEVVIDVLSADAPKIKSGDSVLIDQSGVGPLAARVRLVEPSGFTKISALGVEEQRVNVIADFIESSEKLSQLGDEYRIDARIVVWQNANATKVPSGALFRRGKDWAVFVVRNDRAKLEKIEIGRISSLEAEVLSGLSVGDKVVNYPSDKVRDGVAVTSHN